MSNTENYAELWQSVIELAYHDLDLLFLPSSSVRTRNYSLRDGIDAYEFFIRAGQWQPRYLVYYYAAKMRMKTYLENTYKRTKNI